MKAIIAPAPLPISDPRSLQDADLPDPGPPEGHDLLVRVEAVSVNFLDIKMRLRSYTAAPSAGPRILGWDAAGVVEAVGEAVSLFRTGDAVFYAGSILRPGSNARYQLVDERIVGPKPETLDFARAAALPLTSITAYEAIIERLGVERLGIERDGQAAGRSLLIIGAAGGAGSMGIQIGRALGLTVIATASRPESAEWCRSLGAGAVIDHRAGLKNGLDAAGIGEVDYIFNCADTDSYWEPMIAALKPQGRICSIVGAERPVDLRLLAAKSASFSCESMFTRPVFGTTDLIEQHRLLGRIARWIDDGTLKGTARESLTPISAATLRAAHEKLESRATIGKITLAGWAD